jgi:hypothetical protein
MERETAIIYSQQFSNEIKREGVDKTKLLWKKLSGRNISVTEDKDGRLIFTPVGLAVIRGGECR